MEPASDNPPIPLSNSDQTDSMIPHAATSAGPNTAANKVSTSH